jgi:2-oxoisovalerate dehydrogenase E1 component alpha subunit
MFLSKLLKRFKYSRLRVNTSAFSSAKQCTPFSEQSFDFTSNLSITSSWPRVPTYRVIDLKGNHLQPNEEINIDNETLLKIHETMLKLNEMDQILYMAQRQGKISFYMTSFGEEACSIVTAAALKSDDYIYTQYREQGCFLWRGLTISELCNQCVGNHVDPGKGRQMPIHYGSKPHNMPTVSSPLATQIPQASGTGYAFRVAGDQKICVCFFGEGAASEGDFHPALNFAATLRSQTLFICRNNRYAISTPDGKKK